MNATLIKTNFCCKLFPINLPKLTTNGTFKITYSARLHRIFSAKLFTSSLKFYPSRLLVPVHGCNLALLRDNYTPEKYRLAEFLLFLRPVHNSLRSRFVLMFCLSFSSRSADTLYSYIKYFVHQIKNQEEIIKNKKENFIIFETL